MGDFTQQTNELFGAISQKYNALQVRGRNINRGLEEINASIRTAFNSLGDFSGRIASIVDRIRNLRGLSQAEKDRILKMLRDLDRQADEVDREVQELPPQITQLPEGVQERLQEINTALGQIEQALNEVESGSGAGGGGGGGGARTVVRSEGPPPPDEIDWDAAQREFAAREQGGPGNPPGQGGGKKRRKTRRKRKGRKARKTRQGGYVIPNKRTHSAKGKKTPVAGKKGKSKKSRK